MAEIEVRVQPRSSQNRIEVIEGAVKVWLTAPPTDGQANAALCELVAKKVGIAKTKVCVVRGETSRTKRISLDGVSTENALAKLSE